MYVCLCHGLNDRQVRAAIDEGQAGSAAEVYRHYSCKPQCGKCVSTVHDMVRAAQSPATTGCGRCGDACACEGA
ncbi:(2Fe-2S)-binding protein [Magnetospirillum aberrantis]|uniref:Bacterioferritin-associated ferredoxin n=1 Tax=Magnetospirillum aberrantis SpK TaxID=908842 RepID=A0A7C9QUF8_9PROT|nr:(2Fe-2S)-binding protein [Magnetospirillum aberrantis]NFV80441.1 bfd domain-containing protein (2fe-2S)-binding domain-containing protein [Magnetospirillum aberrantis SpK]